MEGLLRETLVSAERASHDMKEQARKEAELIVAEAHTESRSVTRDAASKKERLEGGLRRGPGLPRPPPPPAPRSWDGTGRHGSCASPPLPRADAPTTLSSPSWPTRSDCRARTCVSRPAARAGTRWAASPGSRL